MAMDRETEITRLRQKLASRDGKPGFKANVVALKQRIAALESGQTPTIAERSDAV
jgi:hypothetical protein